MFNDVQDSDLNLKKSNISQNMLNLEDYPNIK